MYSSTIGEIHPDLLFPNNSRIIESSGSGGTPTSGRDTNREITLNKLKRNWKVKLLLCNSVKVCYFGAKRLTVDISFILSFHSERLVLRTRKMT